MSSRGKHDRREDLRGGKMNFKDLEWEDRPMVGRQAIVMFSNGYGASILTGGPFYISREAPYELAVLKGDDITYDTPIAHDVIGYLTEEAVQETLNRIEALK
jgi:hypothetical protein